MNAPAVNIAREQLEKSKSMQLPLLEGTCDAENAREPVLQMLLDLKRYHQMRNFSHEERFGEPDPWSQKMVQELEIAHSDARRMILDAKGDKQAVKLDCVLKLEVASA